MKFQNLTALNHKLLTLLICFSSVTAFAERSINGFHLRHCTTVDTKCLEVTGKSADGSTLAPIWSVKGAEVRIIDSVTKKEIQKWTEKIVFVDEFSNQILIKDPRSTKEWQILLVDLKVNEF